VENLAIGRGNVPVPLLVIRRLASIVEKWDIWQENAEVERASEGAEIAIIVIFVMIAPVARIGIVMKGPLTMTILVVLRAEMNIQIDTIVIMVMPELVPDLLLDMAEDLLHLLVLHLVLSTVVHTAQVRIVVRVEALCVSPEIMVELLVHLGHAVLLFVLNLALIVR